MQSPRDEISQVIHNLTSTDSPSVQNSAVLKYYTQDAKFRHPICRANSREVLLGIYQWYRILSPRVEGVVKSVTYDEDENVLFVQVEQKFHIWFSPFKPAPAKYANNAEPTMILTSLYSLLVRLTLRNVNDLHFISSQEDFYHQEVSSL